MVFIKTSDGYEEEVMQRAVDYKLDSCNLYVCSAEDLIIHKAVAGRPRDLQDIEGIIGRQGKGLDREYITNWLEEFSQALEKPINKTFERTKPSKNKLTGAQIIIPMNYPEDNSNGWLELGFLQSLDQLHRRCYSYDVTYQLSM